MKPLRGFKDIIEESPLYAYAEGILKQSAIHHGYSEVRLPILENIELFKRSVGEHTDIVGKEMYHFIDQNDEHIALRPEGTASSVRAMINSGIVGRETAKWWYTGAMFRRERPQKGRLRQFHQFGVECFGHASICADIELIQLAKRALDAMGLLQHSALHINYLPSQNTRVRYIQALKDFFEPHLNELSDDIKLRLQNNPLRVLDSKDALVMALVEKAPKLETFYDEQERLDIEKIKTLLTQLDIIYTWNAHLVRGLDYYNGLVFEWQSNLLGSQSAICGGGRYDQLSKILGSKLWPATGLSFGIERLILMLEALDFKPKPIQKCMILCTEEKVAEAFQIQSMIKNLNGEVSIDFQFSSIKKGLSRAHKQGAQYVIILGETLVLKNLLNSDETTVEPESLNQILQETL
jgi:histidyl-tRNA synthetase